MQKLWGAIISRNNQEKLWHEIIRRNYDAKLWASILCRRKCWNYRNTGVSKNTYIESPETYHSDPNFYRNLKYLFMMTKCCKICLLTYLLNHNFLHLYLPSYRKANRYLYIRNHKYAHLRPIFRLHNIHLIFKNCFKRELSRFLINKN